MSEKELELLARAFFRNCAENVKAWRETGIGPEDDEDLTKTKGYTAFRRTNFKIGLGKYESNRSLIGSAETHLNSMGYHTTSIRSAPPGTVSVRIANAGSWRLCVRVPKEIASRIIVLGFVPKI